MDNYKIGVIETKIEDLIETVESMQKDLLEIKIQLAGWLNRAAGALVVLGVIGSGILYLGDTLIQVLRLKLGF